VCSSDLTVHYMIPSDKEEINKKEEIIMEFKTVNEQQWPEIKEIYMEAFPKRERKPYVTLRHSVKKKKAVVMAAMEKNSFWDLQF